MKKYQVQIQDEDGTWDDVPPVFNTLEMANEAMTLYRTWPIIGGVEVRQVRVREVEVDA